MNEQMDPYPTLRRVYDDLCVERDALTASSAPLRAEREMVRAQLQPLAEQERQLNEQIAAIELPRLAELDTEISALARAMGARTVGGE